MDANTEAFSPEEARVRRRHAPRLRVSEFHHKGEVGARVRDRFGGATYSCIARRNTLGRPELAYLTIEPDEGLLLSGVRQADHRQLAVIAEQVALDVASWAKQDRERNARIQQLQEGHDLGGTVGVGSYYVDLESRDRARHDAPSLTWLARLVIECRASNIRVHETVGSLSGLSPSSVDRYIAEAVKVGLLERQKPGRPSKSSPSGGTDV